MIIYKKNGIIYIENEIKEKNFMEECTVFPFLCGGSAKGKAKNKSMCAQRYKPTWDSFIFKIKLLLALWILFTIGIVE